MEQSYYDILECNPNDTPDEIRKKWKKQCLKHHPDKGGDEDMFLSIMHSYKMLTDPSYKHKENQKIQDLSFRIRLTIGFMEAFYGTKYVVNYNRIFLDSQLQPMESEIEPISLSFDIPAGTTTCNITKKGMGSRLGNLQGDAIISINISNHPRYSIHKLDVHASENVPLDIMLKGGEVTVETLWGQKVIWVPAGTKPKDKIKIRNCGVDKKGHQYSIIDCIFPETSDLKSDKWKGLDINWKKVEDENDDDENLSQLFDKIKGKVNGNTTI